MVEDLAPYALVQGWRAFLIRGCHSRLADPTSVLWCLSGMGGMHVHENPAPKAIHRLNAYRPDWVAQGIPEHTYGPLLNCSCGYYALLEPDVLAAVGTTIPLIPVVWGKITALGLAVLHDEGGFRCESYQLECLFWPCRGQDQTVPFPPDYPYRDQELYGYQQFYHGPPDTVLLEDILPRIATNLGVELIRRPLGVWLKEQQGFEDILSSASAALEAKDDENR